MDFFKADQEFIHCEESNSGTEVNMLQIQEYAKELMSMS